VPNEPQPAASQGLSVQREFLTLDGRPANLRALRQNDRVIVSISGRNLDGNYHEVALLDLLPAGFEIETVLTDEKAKPFSFLVLVARIRALIRRGAPARPVIMTLGTLSLDPVSHSVRRGDTLISLTAREYGLLHYLMRRHDQIVSKAEILQNVWDPAFEGANNVVEVYIGYLRRKIDVPFGIHSLTTVRGMGYLLSADPTPEPRAAGSREE